jgi:hypothetical protein
MQNSTLTLTPVAGDHLYYFNLRSLILLNEVEIVELSALIILREPMDMILSGEKSWELRGKRCHKRGLISLIQSKTSGLRVMQNPEERSFLAKLFTRLKTTTGNLKNELNAQEEPLYLIRFAVNLEYMIAQAIGRRPTFQTSITPDICRQAWVRMHPF